MGAILSSPIPDGNESVTTRHQAVYLKLATIGPILLAGDLYHYQEELNTDKTPIFEFDRDQSLASRAAIEGFIKNSAIPKMGSMTQELTQ